MQVKLYRVTPYSASGNKSFTGREKSKCDIFTCWHPEKCQIVGCLSVLDFIVLIKVRKYTTPRK